jgi:hypothetical protein
MARDYLPIQGSASSSERAFSQGGLTDRKQRNRLSPSMFEALQLLKSAYRNGHIQASDKCEGYLDAFVDSEETGYEDSGAESVEVM